MLPAQSPELLELRRLYYQASQDKDAARTLYDRLAALDADAPPLLLGYQGVSDCMLARVGLNPFTKLKHFKAGRKKLDRAIALAPGNVELRSLRFAIQTKAPAFLGYTDDIDRDKEVILNALETPGIEGVDRDLRARMREFMLESKHCSKQEKSRIEREVQPGGQ